MESSRQFSLSTCFSMAPEALRILKADWFFSSEKKQRDHVSGLHLVPSAKALALPWKIKQVADQLSRGGKIYSLVEKTIIKERHAHISSYVSSSASITCQIPEQNSFLFSIHDWRQFWMTKSTAEEHIMKTKCQKVFRKRLNVAQEKAARFRH